MSFKKNLLLIYLVYFSRASVLLLLLPLLIRRLGDHWGTFATLLSFIQLSTTVIEYGFGVTGTKSIAQGEDRAKTVVSIFSAQLFLFFVISLLSIPLLWALKLTVGEHVLALGIVFFMGASPLWFFRGVENIFWMSFFEVFSKIIVLLTIYFFVERADDFVIAVQAYFLGAVIPFLVGLYLIINKYDVSFKKTSLTSAIKENLKNGVYFFGVRVSGILLSVGGSLITGLLGNPLLAGEFAIAERSISAVRSILFPAWDVVFPRIIALFSKDKEGSHQFRLASNTAMTLFAFASSAGLFFYSSEIVKFFSGEIDNQIVLFVQIMSLSPVLVSLINGLGLSYLVPSDMSKQFFISILIGSIIYIISAFSVSLFRTPIIYLSFFYVLSLSVSLIATIFFTRKRNA